MVEFAVESIGAGRKRGKTKIFQTRKQADTFAREEFSRGRGIVIDRLTSFGQAPVVQRGLGKTALAKGKGGKQFTKDFGKFAEKKKKKRSSGTIMYDLGFDPFKIRF